MDAAAEEHEKSLIKRSLDLLHEHFDTVTIMVTRYVPDQEETESIVRGRGNYYARAGQIREASLKMDRMASEPDDSEDDK